MNFLFEMFNFFRKVQKFLFLKYFNYLEIIQFIKLNIKCWHLAINLIGNQLNLTNKNVNYFCSTYGIC